jgi:hypothetical protein
MKAALPGHRGPETKLPITLNIFVKEVCNQPARSGALITLMEAAPRIGARNFGAARSAK